jgi:RNA polymerase sigma factor (TIGR02999 family)
MKTPVTMLLNRWGEGEEEALNDLAVHVHRELHRIARSYLRRESKANTLQPTALVNEAWLRVIRKPQQKFLNRSQFYGIAAHLMRQILVDHARSRQAAKRNGGEMVPLLEGMAIAPACQASVIDVDEALSRLTEIDKHKAEIVEMRYFGGLTAEEIAQCAGRPLQEVRRELRLAQAWLCKELRA